VITEEQPLFGFSSVLQLYKVCSLLWKSQIRWKMLLIAWGLWICWHYLEHEMNSFVQTNSLGAECNLHQSANCHSTIRHHCRLSHPYAKSFISEVNCNHYFGYVAQRFSYCK